VPRTLTTDFARESIRRVNPAAQPRILLEIGYLTELTAGIGAGDMTLYVKSTEGFAASGNLFIEKEEILYTSKTATSFTVSVNGRGVNHTTAASHATGAFVQDGDHLFLSDQDIPLVGIHDYDGMVTSWGKFQPQLIPGDEVVKVSTCSLELFNQPRLDGYIEPGMFIRIFRWFAELVSADKDLVGELILVAQKIARDQGIAQTGYKLNFNVGRGGGQIINHLHLHLLGGW